MSARGRMILCCLGLAVLGGGCRRVYTLVPVEGTITQGGKPLAGAQVTFFTDVDLGTVGPESFGTTDAVGHYELRTYQGATGAVVGHHRVCIIEARLFEDTLIHLSRDKAASMSAALKSQQELAHSKVPAIYGQVNKTPLRAQVRPGSLQTFDFDLP